MDPVSDVIAFGTRFLGAQARQRRSDPFAQSGIVTDRTSPYSKMAKASIPYKSSRRLRKRMPVVSQKRVSRSRKKGPVKRKRLSPLGKFKKPKKVRKIATKYHNHRYEVEGTCNAGQPFMYVGVNDCYSRGAIWDAMADALLRPILAKECKFYPLQDTDKISGSVSAEGNRGKQVIIFDFKVVAGIAGTETLFSGLTSDGTLASTRVDIHDTTYDTMRTRMSSVLQTFAGFSNAGWFPYKYYMASTDTTIVADVNKNIVSSFEHVGDTMIDLRFSQKTMFVNRTLAEGGGAPGQDLDRLGVNPLKGKLYQFNHSGARILDHVDMTTALKTALQSDPPTGMDKYTSTSAADSHMAHPLSAKFWLKNCTKESSIMLQPGQTKSHSTVHKIKGRLSTIIERFYFSGYDKGSFGASSMFMFDMVHKSDQTPSTTYKRTCIVQSAGKLKIPKIYIPDFEAVTENL